MTNREARIVIIGAGVAGLSAAHHLIQNDFKNVVVLEATDRIGGRIHTVEFGNGIIEMGANWIHGIGPENSMFTLAESKGQVMEPYVFLDSDSWKWFKENGTTLDKGIAERALEIFDTIEEDLDDGISEDKQMSCQEYIETRLEKATKRLGKREKPDVILALRSLLCDFGLYEGDDLRHVSANLYEVGNEISDDDVVLINGYKNLLEILINEMPEHTIKFNKKVTCICWEEIEKNNSTVTCKFQENNEEYKADHIIVTCSLGFLKQHHETLFQPKLPTQKVNAIQRMGYGKVGKIFLYYEKPFWEKGDGFFRFVWDDVDDAFNIEECWYKNVVSFGEVPTCPNVLLGWVTGISAEYMEKLSDRQVMNTCTDILRQFLNNRTVPLPTKICKSSWCTDPLSLGAYSFYAVDSYKSCVADIAQPLFVDDHQPVVCFAGEATHCKWFSYAHGARSSGIREAQRIIDFHNQK